MSRIKRSENLDRLVGDYLAENHTILYNSIAILLNFEKTNLENKDIDEFIIDSIRKITYIKVKQHNKEYILINTILPYVFLHELDIILEGFNGIISEYTENNFNKTIIAKSFVSKDKDKDVYLLFLIRDLDKLKDEYEEEVEEKIREENEEEGIEDDREIENGEEREDNEERREHNAWRRLREMREKELNIYKHIWE